jgi:anthranilate synthase component 1
VADRARVGAAALALEGRDELDRADLASLQAGGGIVFDSDEFEEYVETVNKLGANVRCIDAPA